jgi:hypothetical protein
MLQSTLIDQLEIREEIKDLLLGLFRFNSEITNFVKFVFELVNMLVHVHILYGVLELFLHYLIEFVLRKPIWNVPDE